MPGPRRPSDPNGSILHLLHRAGQAARTALTGELARHGVTPRQYVVLQAVSGRPGCSQRELEAVTGVDRSTVADIVARLARRGVLTRATDASDRRATRLALTQDGRRLLRRCRDGAAGAERAILGGLDEPLRDQLRGMLERVSGLDVAPPPPARRARRRPAADPDDGAEPVRSTD